MVIRPAPPECWAVKHTTLNAKIKRYQMQHAGRGFDTTLVTEKHERAA